MSLGLGLEEEKYAMPLIKTLNNEHKTTKKMVFYAAALNENSSIYRRNIVCIVDAILSLTVTFDEFAVALKICILRWATKSV